MTSTRRQQLHEVNDPLEANGMDELTNEPASPSIPSEKIFLFIPNLIGYSRIILALASLHYMPLHPRTCAFLYSISYLLDALDGAAARKLEQLTRFGAALDMVIDRCTTTCLLVFLASAFPRFSIVFQGLISLDLASHYMHMYATLAMSGRPQSHKKIGENRPWVMRIYYSNTRVLFTVCALNEAFFIALYMLSFSSSVLMPSLVEPGDKVARTNKVHSTIPWILLCASCPFMLFKQYVNFIQLIEASKWLADGDVKIRQKAGLSRRE